MSIRFFIENASCDFFKLAEEYLQLEKRFHRETFFEELMFWFEAVVAPLWTMISGSVDLWSVMTIYKAAEIWSAFIRYSVLADMIWRWQDNAVPKIGTNNNRYLPYVFAHELTLQKSAVFAKKCTERFQ
jgi:hypothetical protein